MIDEMKAGADRRTLVKNGVALAGALLVPGAATAAQRVVAAGPIPSALTGLDKIATPKVAARPVTSPRVVRPDLMRRALAALDRHGDKVRLRDRMVVVDFDASSSQPRFHFVDLASGASTSLLVAHGSGSDPAHSGFLKRFSNDFGSNASSEGAFLATDYYVGKHGRSQRLVGLDATNCNALGRAIVVHSAWYANPDMLRTHGRLGRSQGCFAVGERDLDTVFARLGVGRMIYSAKV